MATKSQNYAGFGVRFLASLIDGVILFVVGFVISFAFTMSGASDIASWLSIIISWSYYVYMTGSRGQTLGKMALNLKVVKIDTGEHPDFVHAFLREVVGKIISGIVIYLGYFWVIWDSKKQGWHDKIANTVVVKLN